MNTQKTGIVTHLVDWIGQHQVIAFFILTFAITWGLGFSYGAVIKQGVFLLAPLVFVATCGPALAGIIISAISNTQPKSGKVRTAWIAFLVAWIVVSLAFLAHKVIINKSPLSPVFVVLILIGAIPVAFIISAAFSRIPTVRSYLASLVRLRGVIGWSLLALVLQPGLILLSIAVSTILGRQSTAFSDLTAGGLALSGLVSVVVVFLYQFFFFNCTGEEAGWRGFALPRLQAQVSPLLASLVIAFFWMLWHLFLWQAEGRPILTWEYWIDTCVTHIPATVMIGWLYNRSKGSILVAGIFHAAANTTFAFLQNLDWPVHTATICVAAIVIVLVDRMWKKLPSDHPAVYQASV